MRFPRASCGGSRISTEGAGVPLKVSFLMLGRKDYLSGGYIFNWRMARRLAEEGAEVDVLHFSTVPEGLPGRTLRESAYVCRRIAGFRPDVVVVSKSYSSAGPFRLLQPFLGIPVVYLMHHLEWMDLRNRLKARLYKGYVGWLLGMADAVWVNSTSTMRGVMEAGVDSDRIVCIPPGFEKGGDPLPDRSTRCGPLRLLCVGSIAPRKAQDVLIRACALLPEGSFSLEFAGNTDNGEGYTREVMDLVAGLGLEGSVTFLDDLSREDLAAAYDRADVLVHPARWEAFGMAVVEGMWRGLPVVASDVAALPELVRDGVNGLLVPPDNPEVLAEALGKMKADSDRRLQMGRESRAMALNMNDWDDTGEAFARLVTCTAGGGSHG
jgi:glycosyltransferase involved in cell wall biosynthesis